VRARHRHRAQRTSPSLSILAQTLAALKFVRNIQEGYVQRHLQLELLLNRTDLEVVTEHFVKFACIGAALGTEEERRRHRRASCSESCRGWCSCCRCGCDPLPGSAADDAVYQPRSLGALVATIRQAKAGGVQYTDLRPYARAGRLRRCAHRSFYALSLLQALGKMHTAASKGEAGGAGGAKGGAATGGSAAGAHLLADESASGAGRGGGGGGGGGGGCRAPGDQQAADDARAGRIVAFHRVIGGLAATMFTIPQLLVQTYVQRVALRNFLQRPF
jgi:hypothetical protein